VYTLHIVIARFFFLFIASVREREEKKSSERKIFVLLKREAACTHLMYVRIYGREKKKVHALVREATTRM
jgi:hypothetical protein